MAGKRPQQSKRSSGCKLPLILLAASPTGRGRVRGYYHPRGCMKARLDHVDLEKAEPLDPLYEIARPRGVKLRCYILGDTVETEYAPLGVWLRLKLLQPEGVLVCSEPTLYAMVTRGGMLYLAPLRYRKQKPHGI